MNCLGLKSPPLTRPQDHSAARSAGRLLALWLLSSALNAADDPAPEAAVRHELSFPQRNNQYVHVSSAWPAAGDSLELIMPSWTPGSYLIRDFSANLEALTARDGAGTPRRVEKVAKNRWRIDARGTPELIVDYAVWAGELNVATSWVEASGALLNAAGTYLYSEESRNLPQQVTLRLPDEWAAAHTSLAPGASPYTYRARDFDELIDSPIVAGNQGRHEFRVQGHPFALVVPGDNPLWDAGRARDDIAKIVEAQLEFWRDIPFEREYLFMNFFMGPFGGLEHDHGTVMMCSPWQMSARQDYIKWLGLVSHEFFHAWNVRRMRPAALAEYDYEREMYTRELWLAEGLTSYYDALLLFRSGLIDVVEYLELLAQEIHNYETMPGREVRSAEHASFDTWIKQYQPDENSVNSTVSYYRKGAVIGFVTDTAIRRETDNEASLDTVMRALYERYGPAGPGRGAYPPGAFEVLVEQVAGAGVRTMVENLLRKTDDPDVDEALSWYGLKLDRTPLRTAAEISGGPAPGGLGVVWVETGGRLLAERVILGHSGAAAGILPGDELLAIDGYRMTIANYDSRFQRLEPGQRAQLTLVRHERLLTLEVDVQHAIPERYVVVESRIRRTERARLQAWLGRELRFQP